MAEHFHVGCGIKQSLFVFDGTITMGARPGVRGQSLGVSTRELAVGAERVIEEYSLGAGQKCPRFFQLRIRFP